MANQRIYGRGQITITDMNDSVQAGLFITPNKSLTQIYVKDNNTFIPDWSVSPYLTLTPGVFISGIPGDSITTAGIIKAGSTKWEKIDSAGTATVLTSGTDYTIATTAPFKLTVKKNQLLGTSGNNPSVKFRFSAIMIDPSSSLETNISAYCEFTGMAGTNASLNILVSCPDGIIFKNDEVQSLRITADVWRGSTVDNTDIEYDWALKEPGVFKPTTTAASAASGQKIVTFTSIDNVVPGQFCTINGTRYTIASVDVSTKKVTMTSNLTAAVASGVAITHPFYDADLDVNWAKISSDAWFDGVTGYQSTSNTITVPADAVIDLETYKVVAKDIDSTSPTYNQTVSGFASLTDVTDPIQIDIAAPQGTTIKNGNNNITLRADVWRGGMKIDEAGTDYEYRWVMFDKDGNVNTAFTDSTDPAVNRGKTLDISNQQISGKATFEMTLYSLA